MAQSTPSSVLEEVRSLHSQMKQNPKPESLVKYLQSLLELPVTMDVVKKTGIGSTVDALRKYEQVAILAARLMTQWKKIPPVVEIATQEDPNPYEPKQQVSKKRPHEVLPNDKKGNGNDQKSLCGQSVSNPGGGQQKYPRLQITPENFSRWAAIGRKISESKDMKGKVEKREETRKVVTKKKEFPMGKGTSLSAWDEFEKWKTEKLQIKRKGETVKVGTRRQGEIGKAGTEREGEIGKNANPQQGSKNYVKPQDQKADQLGPPQKPYKSFIDLVRQQEFKNPDRSLGKPEIKGLPYHRPRKYDLSSEKKKPQVSERGKGRQENVLKVAPRAQGSHSSFKIIPKEKQPVASASKGKPKPDSSSDPKKSGPSSQLAPGKSIKKPKNKDEPQTEMKESKISVDNLQGETKKGKLTLKIKDQECSDELKRQGKRVAVSNENSSLSKIQKIEELEEEDDDFERHSMSFESYLLYDQPPNGRVLKSQTLGGTKDHPKLKTLLTEKTKQSADKNPPKENSGQPKKLQVGAGSAPSQKNSKGISDLPSRPGSSSVRNPSSFSAQTMYRPPFSREPNPTFQQKNQAPSIYPHSNPGASYGRTVNSTTSVRSLTTTTSKPRVLSLYEQCIKVLERNIHLMYEVGQVPFSVLAPLLETCSPVQLYRIEEYNPIFLEDSDNLWKVHCFQYFNNEQPEEFESWRDLYLRLHDAQEQRLYNLTKAIQLAQAKKPKVRQTKMVFITPTSRSPHDVLGKQMVQVRLPPPNASIKAIQQSSDSRLPLANGDSCTLTELSDDPTTGGVCSAQSGSSARSDSSKKVASRSRKISLRKLKRYKPLILLNPEQCNSLRLLQREQEKEREKEMERAKEKEKEMERAKEKEKEMERAKEKEKEMEKKKVGNPGNAEMTKMPAEASRLKTLQ